VYRADILKHAYALVRSNQGSPGIDGITFEAIEGGEGLVEGYLTGIAEELKAKRYRPMAVRRVYLPKSDGGKRPLGIPTIKDRVVQMATKLVIEPIFEADFQEMSYGFRPKRNAHQAIADVTRNLAIGRTEVIDADISKYFDTIPHDRLMQEVAKRIVDKNILRLIKMWLKAPIVEEREDGKTEYRRNDKGTPQGGVISPLLANIYLNILDTLWKTKRVEERMSARLVRYADDCVVLCKGKSQPILEGMKRKLGELGLSLHETKTRVVNAKEEAFNFLGFTLRMVKSRRSGKSFPLTRPSVKSLKQVRKAIKANTQRDHLATPTDKTVKKLNEIVRGWVGYFYYRHCSQDFSHLNEYLKERVRNYLRRKHRNKGRGYQTYPNRYLYEVLGLYRIPTTAPWTQTMRKP
jgi:group II intron reverse transcriptase/maturase